MVVASGYGEQEAGVASGSWCNLWVWLLGVVVRKYIRMTYVLPVRPTRKLASLAIIIIITSRMLWSAVCVKTQEI